MLRLKAEKDLSQTNTWIQTARSVKRRLARQGSVAVSVAVADAAPVRLRAARLSKRTVIAIEGDDALGFVEDLTTNSLAHAAHESFEDDRDGALATAFLTAQGTLQQFCLAVRTPHGLWLECDRARLDTFAETLWKARLGRAVSFRWLKEMQVVGLFPENTQKSSNFVEPATGSTPRQDSPSRQEEARHKGQPTEKDEAADETGYLFADPRKPLAATRLWHNNAEDLLHTLDLTWVEEEDYESYRLALAVVERAEEWEGEKEKDEEGKNEEKKDEEKKDEERKSVVTKKHALPFAFGLDDLGVMDWKKDCYVGQEISARLKYRARMPKKHALPVRVVDHGCVAQGVDQGREDHGADQGGEDHRRARAGDSVYVETKEAGETLCGEVLHAVATAQQTILLVLFQLASLRLAPPREQVGKQEPSRREEELSLPPSARKKLVVLCASGERLQGELLLPRWLAGLWETRQDKQGGTDVPKDNAS